MSFAICEITRSIPSVLTSTPKKEESKITQLDKRPPAITIKTSVSNNALPILTLENFWIIKAMTSVPPELSAEFAVYVAGELAAKPVERKAADYRKNKSDDQPDSSLLE